MSIFKYLLSICRLWKDDNNISHPLKTITVNGKLYFIQGATPLETLGSLGGGRVDGAGSRPCLPNFNLNLKKKKSKSILWGE